MKARITDHAVLRYLERVRGMDIEAIRAEILTDERRKAIELGASAIKVPEHNFALKVRGGAVVTCLNLKDKKGPKSCHKAEGE